MKEIENAKACRERERDLGLGIGKDGIKGQLRRGWEIGGDGTSEHRSEGDEIAAEKQRTIK